MKNCSDCNVYMIEGLGIRADESISIDNAYRLYIVENENSYYGKRLSEKEIKCRICPICGKIELYIDPNILKSKKL